MVSWSAELLAGIVAGYNNSVSFGTTNDASLGGNAGLDAAGNVGINIAAGDSNVQANQLALASASGALATATASSNQAAFGNVTSNNAVHDTIVNTVDVSLSGDATGTYTGTADQVGDVYLDTWDSSPTHPGGSNTGHIDVDNQVQGAQDLGSKASDNEKSLLALVKMLRRQELHVADAARLLEQHIDWEDPRGVDSLRQLVASI